MLVGLIQSALRRHTGWRPCSHAAHVSRSLRWLLFWKQYDMPHEQFAPMLVGHLHGQQPHLTLQRLLSNAVRQLGALMASQGPYCKW